jgi:WD40 repeat protein
MSRCLTALFLALVLIVPPTPGAPALMPGERKDALGEPLPPHCVLRVGTVRFRHGDAVTALAVSPDGKVVASAGRDDVIRVWELATGTELIRWHQDDDKGTTVGVYALAISLDGKRLVSAGTGAGKTTVWETGTGRALRAFEKTGGPHPFVALLGDGDTLLLRRDRSMQLVAASTGEAQRTFSLENSDEPVRRRDKDEMETFAVSPDGSFLLTGQPSGTVRLFDVAKGMELRKLDADYERVSALALSLDNQLYAVGTAKGQLRIGKIHGDPLHDLTPDGNRWIDGLAFSPDGKQLACGGGGGVISLIDTETGKATARIDAHADGVTCLAFTSDGQWVVSGGIDSCIRVWDARTGKEQTPTHDNRGRVLVALSPDGNRLATYGPNQPIRCWDTATGKETRSLSAGATYTYASVMFSADGSRLTALTDKTLRSWDLETGRELSHWHLGREFQQGALSPDGRTIVGRSTTSKLYLYHVQTHHPLPIGKAAPTLFRYLISPDSQSVCTLGNAGDVRQLDPATGKESFRFKVPARVFNLAFTPDRKMLITLSTGSQGERWVQRITRWVLDWGVPLPSFQGEQGEPVSLAVSPDGKTLATGDDTGVVRLWEVATGKPRGVLKGHQGAVVALAFSADGMRLASGSKDTTALLWDLPSAALGERSPPPFLDGKDMDGFWDDLRSDDAARAYRAVTVLAGYPEQAVPFLRARLRPASCDPRRLADLIADLDSRTFETRQKAHAELVDNAEFAEPLLRTTLKAPRSAEVRRHIENLLEEMKTAPFNLAGERLRTWRALEALEKCGTGDARDALTVLAKGGEASRLTREAKMALERLRKRGVAVRAN